MLFQFYSEQAQKVWDKMADINDHQVLLTHDGYLKLYQLQAPVLSRNLYDVILIDEAQDLTPGIFVVFIYFIHISDPVI